jgi:hypothetical protein
VWFARDWEFVGGVGVEVRLFLVHIFEEKIVCLIRCKAVFVEVGGVDSRWKRGFVVAGHEFIEKGEGYKLGKNFVYGEVCGGVVCQFRVPCSGSVYHVPVFEGEDTI